MTQPATTPTPRSLLLLDEPPAAEEDAAPADPGELLLTCASCGARMEDRRCKLICRCGYFLSCSDYL
jgi:hypothetical protein